MKPLNPDISEPGHRVLDRLRRAQSEQEIRMLLSLGAHFSHASHRTEARWRKAADRRRKELQ